MHSGPDLSYGENRWLDDLPLVGFGVVEVAPAYDSTEITAPLAADLVYAFLPVLAANR
jgi:arginase family enzyme